MPELPEAETIRRQLAKEVVEATICKVEVHIPRAAREHGSPEELAGLVEGRQIGEVGRRGKAVLLLLDGQAPTTLIIRLGMTGLLRVIPAEEPLAKGTAATLHLRDGRQIRFLDQRTFGGMIARSGHDVDAMPEFSSYGPEPFGDGFTASYLRDAFSRRSAKLGLALMDQRVIAGIGKIYSDEICFRAGLRPGRSVSRLSGPMLEHLCQAAREVLAEGIDCRGSSARDETYVDVYGMPGNFQDRICVYQRTGQPCRVCGSPIRRTPIPGGRGMHWCPNCQQ